MGSIRRNGWSGFWQDSPAVKWVRSTRCCRPATKPPWPKGHRDPINKPGGPQLLHDGVGITRQFKLSINLGLYVPGRMLTIILSHPPSKETRIVTIPNQLFVEVILGIRIPTKQKEEIISICKSRNIPVFQSYPVPFKFEISFDQIA